MGRKKKPRYGFLNKNKFYRRIGSYASSVLAGGLIITISVALLTYLVVESRERREFLFITNGIRDEVIECLEDQALMLRAINAYMSLSDTVSRKDWRSYIELANIQRFMPEYQGVGYVEIVPESHLNHHLNSIKKEGFPDYRIFPSYSRDIYTSIVYIEPFTGRNRRAFGYDMYTEPVRRKAMAYSCDNDMASLTGRFRLEIDTGGEELYGSLMFVPFYDKFKPVNTPEQRRAAIKGWIYSPYRIKTLMDQVFEYTHPESDIRVKIFDEVVSDSTIMYDSYGIGTSKIFGLLARRIQSPIDFNHNRWMFHFSQPRNFPILSFLILITGSIISILLYLLMKGFWEIENRSRQIRTKNKQLRTLNATKDKFFSIIAHDLKSPYNAVLGFSELLVNHIDKMDKDEISRVGVLIHKSAGSAVDLLTNLMVWSQSHTGRIKFSPEELDSAQMVDEAIYFMEDVATRKNVHIIKNVRPGIMVYADKYMLNTILRNLISNAIKFSHPDGTVTVTVDRNLYDIVFSIADTGVGISDENLNKLFRIDETISTAGTGEEEGTGLGLILCKTFVDKHKGRIWAESRKSSVAKSGTTFRFTIPVMNVE